MSFPAAKTYYDGQSGVADQFVQWLNVKDVNGKYAKFAYREDDLGMTAKHIEHTDADDNPTGSTTTIGSESGSVTIQLKNAADPIPDPTDIMGFRGKFYVVSADVKAKRKKSDTVVIQLPLKKLINPLFRGLLSAKGQLLEVSMPVGSSTNLIDTDAVNIAYTNKSFDAIDPETGQSTLPPGVVIDPATGIITGAPAEAGIWESTVACRTWDGENERRGIGHIKFTITP